MGALHYPPPTSSPGYGCIPFVLWTGVWTTIQTPFHRLAFPLTRWIYRHADAIAVYGEHVRHYLVEQGVQREKIFVAAHAVDNALYSNAPDPIEKARPMAELSLEGKKVVLYLSRLEEIKGLDCCQSLCSLEP